MQRLIAPRLPGLLFTLPLPLAAIALAWPGGSPGYWPFFVWAVALILWMWNHEANARATAGLFILTSGMGVVIHFAGPALDLGSTGLRLACLGGLLLLAAGRHSAPDGTGLGRKGRKPSCGFKVRSPAMR